MKTEFVCRDGEILTDILGYEGLYAISNFGRVLSYSKKQNGWLRTERRMIIDNRGYYRVCIGKNGVKETLKVHRVVGIHFIPNDKNLNEINHIDCNKLNNHVDNLEWCTRKQNMIHAFQNNRIIGHKGSSNPISILTEEQACEIHKSTLKASQLAVLYNCSTGCIYDIRGGRSWKHITNGVKSKKS